MAMENNKGMAVLPGVLSPVRLKPVQAEIQNPDIESRLEAESNTSTVALRAVGSNEKEVSNLRQ
jgi:hypothetical protein